MPSPVWVSGHGSSVFQRKVGFGRGPSAIRAGLVTLRAAQLALFRCPVLQAGQADGSQVAAGQGFYLAELRKLAPITAAHTERLK